MSERLSPRRLRVSLPWALAFLLASLCALVPFLPGMPGEGLDLSWELAMNQAVAQGLVFGRDLVFTFGPYAAVYSHMFHPATDARMVWASVVLAVALAAVLSLLLRRGWRARVALLLILSGLMYSRDALYMFYMVAAGALCEQLGRSDEGAAPEGQGAIAVTLFLLFAPLGLLPLVKGSMLAPAALIAALACALCGVRRQWWAALAVVLGPVVGGAIAWHLAAQPWSGLRDYLAAMLPIVAGYTEAMSSTGKPVEILLFLLAAGAMVWTLARRDAPRAERALLLLMFAAGLFLAFKSGFVRHDAHAGMAGLFLLLACCILPWPVHRVGNTVTLALVLLASGEIDHRYFDTTPARFAAQAWRTYAEAWQGLHRRMTAPDSLAADYQATLQRLAARSAFGRLAGSTDVYSHQQIEVIAPGNQWSPRPVLQSYSAYTPDLAERDRQHLAGPRAPDQVVFRVEAIDGRLPPLEDGPSWPELLARYEPADLKGDALLLRKRAAPRTLADCGTQRLRHALGETVNLPAGDCAAFVRFDLRPSTLGAVSGLFYKPSQLDVQLQMADGTRRKYRLIAGMARAGLLLSPLVENAADFGLLYAGPEQLNYKGVRSLAVTARNPSMWNASYTIEFRGLRLPPDPTALRLYAQQEPARAAAEGVVQPAPGCMASMDILNGVGADQPFSAGRMIMAHGWLATAQGQSPAQVFLVLTDAAGRHFLIPAQRTQRPDVAGHFGNPALAGSGFEASGSVAALRGAFHLTLGYEDQGHIKTCPRIDVPGVLSGAQ
ncbi:hypothetical protein [Ramlibacter sp.]|uniref:hypothetical protein n=1 Tax=Ramlibacter sp. TaxID=1917967 RepID=UPI00261CF779|nr:hypothetical protein [Ramlibacter sp.]MDB5957134.1 hypothetical protein [Ramlibacter sp.]